ncbi:MAG: phosphate ABC transporter permease subunit PstC [Cyanobacteria bacterium J06639_18]
MTTNPQDVRSALPHRSKLDKSLDKGFVSLTRVFALAVAAVLLAIAVQVAIQALPAIQEFGANFISQSSWNPVRETYGALPVIYGTLVSSFIGLLIAVPIGVGTAILLSENLLPVSIRTILVFLVELLAAIPSVVYGIWGIFVLIPFLGDLAEPINKSFGWLPFFGTPSSGTLEGPSMLPAGIILAVMTLPIITAISRDALISVPRNLREAAVGLGATRWETILKVLVPAAFSGIVSAVMLALGRAMGETMAVTMIIGNSNKIEASLFAPANTISSLLANQFAEADGIQIAALMYAALILFFLTLIVNVLAELVVLRVKKL